MRNTRKNDNKSIKVISGENYVKFLEKRYLHAAHIDVLKAFLPHLTKEEIDLIASNPQVLQKTLGEILLTYDKKNILNYFSTLLIDFKSLSNLKLKSKEEIIRSVLAVLDPTTKLRDIKETLASIKQALSQDVKLRDGAKRINKIPITCLPKLRMFNAVIGRPPMGSSSDPFILVDDKLLLFIYDMNKVLLHCLIICSSGHLDGTPEKPQIIKDFICKWANYFDGLAEPPVSSSFNMPQNIDKGLARFILFLNKGQLVFIICHELAHYILGHLEKSDTKEFICNFKPPLVLHLYRGSQELEIQADMVGASLSFITFDYYQRIEKAQEISAHSSFINAMPDFSLTLLRIINEQSHQQEMAENIQIRQQKLREFISIARPSVIEDCHAFEWCVRETLRRG